MDDTAKKNPVSEDVSDRILGALWGLVAGDRNGGPMRMALRLAASLISCRGFNKDDLVQHYLNWFQGPPHDDEKAYDTGATFYSIFKKVKSGMHIDVAGELVFQEIQNAGVNAAHRCVPLACCGWISENDLLSITATESRITHRSPISVEIAAIHVTLLRNLIMGKSWEESLEIAKKIPHELSVKNIFKSPKLNIQDLSPGGFAPNVMEAALFFLNNGTDFASMVENSLAFAGSANYCPVLVGALAGARYGFRGIPEYLLHHDQADNKFKEKMKRVADELLSSWSK